MNTLTVFLVRHAEKAAGGGDDPTLSAAGKARARLLTRMIRDSGLAAIFASGATRTRETAKPLVVATGLPLQEVPDVDRTVEFLRQLQQSSASPLGAAVVGHSNTLGPIIAGLGGPPVAPIGELEVDRLFVLTVFAPGQTSLASMKYGGANPTT